MTDRTPLREAELLPCPFCGNDEITFYAVEDMLAADCRECGAHGPIILDGKAVTKPSLAGEAWNTRTPPLSSPEQMIERVARAMSNDLARRHYGREDDSWDEQTDYHRNEWMQQAKAAIAALFIDEGK